MTAGRRPPARRAASKDLLLVWFALLLGALGAALFARVTMPTARGDLWVTSIIAVAISIALLKHRIGLFRLNALSIPAVWWYGFMALVFIPAHFVIQDLGEAVHAWRQAVYVSAAPVYLGAIQIALIAVSAGIAVTAVMARSTETEIVRFHERAVDVHWREQSVRWAYWLLLIAAAMLTALYFYEAPQVPLIQAVRTPRDSVSIAFSREEAFKLLDSPFVYWYDVLRRVWYPAMVALAMAYAIKSRRPVWVVLFVLTLCGELALGGATTAKMPLAMLSLVLGLTWYLLRSGKVGLRWAVVVVVAIATFPALVMALSLDTGFDDIGRIFDLLWQRLAYAPAEILYEYFTLFPETEPFLYGRSIGKLSFVLGVEPVDVENLVFIHAVGGPISTGTASAPFIGNLWADFGWPGIVLGSFTAGVLMQITQIWLIRQRKTIPLLATLAAFMWCFAAMNLQSFAVTLMSGGGVFLALFFLGFSALTNLLGGVRRQYSFVPVTVPRR